MLSEERGILQAIMLSEAVISTRHREAPERHPDTILSAGDTIRALMVEMA